MNKIIKLIAVFLLTSFLYFHNNKATFAQTYTCSWVSGGNFCQLLDNSECLANGCTSNCNQFGGSDCFPNPHPCICTPQSEQLDLERLYASINFRFGGGSTIGNIISASLSYLFPLAGLILLIFIIIGGFKLMTSAGDPKAAQSAKGVLTTAFVGFIIIFLAYWLTRLIATVLGLEQIKTIF